MAAADDVALTSGVSGRIITIIRILKTSVRYPYHSLIRSFLFLQSVFVSLVLLLRRCRFGVGGGGENVRRRRLVLWRRVKVEEADVAKRRALAEKVVMDDEEEDDDEGCGCRWRTELFYGVRNNALFCRSWFPSSDVKLR